MAEGPLPHIVICPITPGMVGPPNLAPQPFLVGDIIEQNIFIPDRSITIRIGEVRKITLREPVHEVNYFVKKTGESTREINITVHYTDNKKEHYSLSV